MFDYNVDDRIQLKLLEPRYAEEIYHIIVNDRRYLRQWLPWIDGTNGPEDIALFIHSTLEAFKDNNGFHAAIFYQGRIVGCIGLHGIDWQHRKTSIGYWLASGFQGRGIMTKSCHALVRHVILELGINRIEIRAAVQNQRSRAIPERLGFTNEGTIREAEWLYDHYVDHIVYGLLKREWGAKKDLCI